MSQPPTRCSSGSTSRTEAAEVELGEANEAGPRGTRVSGQGTYRLELTREQADRLLRLVSIAELAIVGYALAFVKALPPTRAAWFGDILDLRS